MKKEELAAAIRRELRWGPVNTDAGLRAGFKCEYCGKELLASVRAYYGWEIDHIVPGAGDDLDNIALACRTCNHVKHMYEPIGDTREARIWDASREIRQRLERKATELEKLRHILGLDRNPSVSIPVM